MAMFDYSNLIKDATYQGTYVRNPDDPNDELNVSHVGKFCGMNSDQMLKIMGDPDGKCRQVPLLCDDPKFGKAWRFFEPETLVLVDDTQDGNLDG